MTYTTTTKNAPESGQGLEGNDQNPSKGTIMDDATSVPDATDTLRVDLYESAQPIARLIWDHAEDMDFLNIALIDTIAELRERGEPHTRGALRFALMRIADELRLMVPNRAAFGTDENA